MTALPSPASPPSSGRHKRPAVLRPEARPALPTTTPPRRVPTKPRVQVQPPRNFSRWWKAALLAGVAGCSAFGVVKVASVVEKSESLPLRTVIVAGVPADSARAAEVEAWAELEEGAAFFSIDTAAVEARVEQHPFIREATVRRLPPDTLEITVEERAARALVRAPSGLYLVDEDGELMKRARPTDSAALDLPLLSVRDVKNAAGALALVRAATTTNLLSRVSEVIELEATGFELVLDDGPLNGARVRVGSTDFEAKLRRLAQTEERLKAQGRSASFVWLDDARHPERVAVRLRSTTETSSGGG